MYDLTCPGCGVTFAARGAYMNHGRGKGATCTPEMRFWGRVDKNGPIHSELGTPCWLYMGFRKWDGYGWLSRGHKFMTAHRYAWILTNGQPDKGAHILHRCDNPPCCNPEHLRLGTHQENMADCSSKLRHAYGERCWNAKMNYAKAEECRRLYADGWAQGALAERYGVTRSHISGVINYRYWSVLHAADHKPQVRQPRPVRSKS